MREILFRGKHITADKWVISPSIRQEEYDNIYLLAKRTWYNVNPETLGQYTGLTDKNGKKIFEGDIVKISTGGIFKIVFYKSCFAVENVAGTTKSNLFAVHDLEVIGNIHDNPELLEVQG